MGINVEAAKPNYKNVRYTAKGNQYRKTNIGKLVGAAGMSLVPTVSFIKNRNTIKQAFSQISNMAQNAMQQSGISIDAKELASMTSKSLKAGIAATVGIFALIGLGIGGLGDFIANKVKAHKADKENTGTIV